MQDLSGKFFKLVFNRETLEILIYVRAISTFVALPLSTQQWFVYIDVSRVMIHMTA